VSALHLDEDNHESHDHDHDLPNPIVLDHLDEPTTKLPKKNFHPKIDPNLSSDLLLEAKIKDKISHHDPHGSSPPIFDKSSSKLKSELISRKIFQEVI